MAKIKEIEEQIESEKTDLEYLENNIQDLEKKWFKRSSHHETIRLLKILVKMKKECLSKFVDEKLKSK